ncbi:MAG: type II toxin-antitoxin system death-on-curing family toxin [Planctomycetaceae bacterium]
MGLASAIANPGRTFGDQDLYPSLIDIACTLLWLLVQNHPLVDGNKRIGHVAAELFLRRKGKSIHAPVDEAERIVLAVAVGFTSRDELTAWLARRIVDRPVPDLT